MARKFYLTVRLSNSGGVLDMRTVPFLAQEGLERAERTAAREALEMIKEAGSLRPGDMITVSETEAEG